MRVTQSQTPDCEICILAGGLSKRMGRNKASLQIGGKTMLSQVTAVARETGLKVRIIRRDQVPRCGPLGGVFTALNTTRHKAVIFLACDMPFISVQLIEALTKTSFDEKGIPSAMFTCDEHVPGFPFLLPAAVLPMVDSQLERKAFSLSALARVLKARRLRLSAGWKAQLKNINTPEDFVAAKPLIKRRLKTPGRFSPLSPE